MASLGFHHIMKELMQILFNFFFVIFQVTVPLGYHDNCPVSVSFVAKHGDDRFLLDTLQNMYKSLQEQVDVVVTSKSLNNAISKEQSAEIAKEKVVYHICFYICKIFQNFKVYSCYKYDCNEMYCLLCDYIFFVNNFFAIQGSWLSFLFFLKRCAKCFFFCCKFLLNNDNIY